MGPLSVLLLDRLNLSEDPEKREPGLDGVFGYEEAIKVDLIGVHKNSHYIAETREKHIVLCMRPERTSVAIVHL